MIATGDEFAGGVQATLEEMETGGAIMIVVKIVFAGPQKLDGHADLLGDGPCFEHVIVGEATTESAASALQVNDDVVVGNIQHFGDEQTAVFWRLTGRPEFELAVVIVRETIFGLHGSVREEGIEVGTFDGFRGGLKGFVGVAVLAKSDGGGLLGGSVGDDGDAPMQAKEILRAFHLKGMTHAWHSPDLVEVGANTLPRIDGALVIDGVQHSRNLEVNTVEIFSCDNGRVVHAASGVAD